MLTSRATTKGLADDGGRLFRPDKRRRVRIPFGEVAFDVAYKGADGIERPAAHRLARQNAEPRLHHVEPRGPGRREMKLDARMRGQPGLHRGGRMRRRVVENDMQR